MTVNDRATLGDVAFAVCTALDEAGIRAVLTGGSAAAVYAPEVVQSLDLDFIIEFSGGNIDAEAVLAGLGYRSQSGSYVHRTNSLILEFPKGPLQVGGDLIAEYDTLRDQGRLLYILNATDSCRDRLAGFLFWGDIGSLVQAVAVARAQAVDLAAIANWCQREGHEEKFARFERSLHKTP